MPGPDEEYPYDDDNQDPVDSSKSNFGIYGRNDEFKPSTIHNSSLVFGVAAVYAVRAAEDNPGTVPIVKFHDFTTAQVNDFRQPGSANLKVPTNTPWEKFVGKLGKDALMPGFRRVFRGSSEVPQIDPAINDRFQAIGAIGGVDPLVAARLDALADPQPIGNRVGPIDPDVGKRLDAIANQPSLTSARIDELDARLQTLGRGIVHPQEFEAAVRNRLHVPNQGAENSDRYSRLLNTAQSPIGFNREQLPNVIDQAAEKAFKFIPNTNVITGDTANERAGPEGRQQFGLVARDSGQIQLTTDQVDEARTLASNMVSSLKGGNFGEGDQSKVVANMKQNIQKQIGDYFKRYTDNIEKAFKDDPKSLEQGKELAQSMRNMVFRATNVAIKDIATSIGGGSFNDYAGAQRINIEELQSLAQSNPSIRRELQEGYGGVAGFVGAGGGFLGGQQGGPAFRFDGGGFFGGGGGRGGRFQGFGRGISSSIYGVTRVTKLSIGNVVEAGQAFADFEGQFSTGQDRPDFGVGGFQAREQRYQQEIGRAAYTYTSAWQSLRLLASANASAVTGGLIAGGIGAAAYIGTGSIGVNIATRLGASQALIKGLPKLLGRFSAFVGGLQLGASGANALGINQDIGRDFDILDIIRIPAATLTDLAAQRSGDRGGYYQALSANDPALLSFITGGFDLRTQEDKDLSAVATFAAYTRQVDADVVVSAAAAMRNVGVLDELRVPEDRTRDLGQNNDFVTAQIAIATSGGALTEDDFPDVIFDTTPEALPDSQLQNLIAKGRALGFEGDEGHKEFIELSLANAAAFADPNTPEFTKVFERITGSRTREDFQERVREGQEFDANFARSRQFSDQSRPDLARRIASEDTFTRGFYNQAQGQLRTAGFSGVASDLLSSRALEFDTIQQGASFLAGTAAALGPYAPSLTVPEQVKAGQGIAATYEGLSPNQGAILTGIYSGDLGALNYAANNDLFGIGPEFRSRDQAGRPIYSNLQAFVDFGEGQAATGNQSAIRFFGSQEDRVDYTQRERQTGIGPTEGAQGAADPSNLSINRPRARDILQAGLTKFGGQGFTEDQLDTFEGGYNGRVGLDAVRAEGRDKIFSLQQASAGLQLQGIVAQQEHLFGSGSPLSPGPGSLFALQDTQRALTFSSTLASFAESQQRLTLGNQFGIRREGIEDFRMDLGTDMQRFNRGFQRGGMDLQRRFALEDRQTDDQMRGLQFSFQMEDLDEAIRLSGGRDRRSLIKQRDRVTTVHNLEEQQIERNRERQELLWAREDERFDKQTEYEETLITLNKESFDLNVEQRQVMFDLDQETLNRRLSDAKEMHDVQQLIIDKQRVFQNEQLERQKQQIGISLAIAAAQKQLNDAASLTVETFQDVESEMRLINKYDNVKQNMKAMESLAKTVDQVSASKIYILIRLFRTLIEKGSISASQTALDRQDEGRAGDN